MPSPRRTSRVSKTARPPKGRLRRDFTPESAINGHKSPAKSVSASQPLNMDGFWMPPALEEVDLPLSNTIGPVNDDEKPAKSVSASQPLNTDGFWMPPALEEVDLPLSNIMGRVNHHTNKPKHFQSRNLSTEPRKCPDCNAKIDKKLFDSFARGRRMTSSTKRKLCLEHTRRAEQAQAKRLGYPPIDWESLCGRLHAFNRNVAELISAGVQPRYEREYEEYQKIPSGRARTWKQVDSQSAGYYGPRGTDIM
jgi:hypothetical protein